MVSKDDFDKAIQFITKGTYEGYDTDMAEASRLQGIGKMRAAELLTKINIGKVLCDIRDELERFNNAAIKQDCRGQNADGSPNVFRSWVEIKTWGNK